MKPFDLRPGEWWQVPDVGNSWLSDVYASPSPGPGAQTTIVTAWGGGCYDSRRKELLVWNGGHTDYAGNELYAFCCNPESANFLTWRRKTYYSTADTDDSDTYSDGSPAARHTYASLAYHPDLDQMIVSPGGSVYDSGGFLSASWAFDCTIESPNTAAPQAWLSRDANSEPGENNANLAWDEFSRRMVKQRGTTGGGRATFHPAGTAGTQWVTAGGPDAGVTVRNSCIVAQTAPRRLLHTISGNIVSRRLDTNAFEGGGETGVNPTGDTNIFSATNPGINWNPVLGKVVLWGGTQTGGTDNRDTYLYDAAAFTVTRQAGFGDIPSNPTPNGVFGRFAYLGDSGGEFSGLHVLVNAADGHVYFYRSSAVPEGIANGPGFMIGSPWSFVGEMATGAPEFVPGQSAENGPGLVIGSPYSFIGEAMTGAPEFVPRAEFGPGFVIGGELSFTGEMATGASDAVEASGDVVLATVATHTQSGLAPQLKSQIQVPARAHTYTSQIPQVRTKVQPAQATHSYVDRVPQVQVKVQPPARAHTYTSQTPQVRSKVQPAQATHTYTDRVPNIVTGSTVVPPAVVHTYTGRSPQAKTVVVGAVASHIYTDRIPQAKTKVQPGQSTHAYTARAPQAQVRVQPPARAHTYSSVSPQLKGKVQPAQATHAYVDRVPSVTTGFGFTAATAAHSYAVRTPQAKSNVRPGPAQHYYFSKAPEITSPRPLPSGRASGAAASRSRQESGRRPRQTYTGRRK